MSYSDFKFKIGDVLKYSPEFIKRYSYQNNAQILAYRFCIKDLVVEQDEDDEYSQLLCYTIKYKHENNTIIENFDYESVDNDMELSNPILEYVETKLKVSGIIK